jgi:hypothetical protein
MKSRSRGVNPEWKGETLSGMLLNVVMTRQMFPPVMAAIGVAALVRHARYAKAALMTITFVR